MCQHPFITVDGDEGTIRVMIGRDWLSFSLSANGCRDIAELFAAKGICQWSCSSTVDHLDEYEHVFARNVSDVVVEELEKFCV